MSRTVTSLRGWAGTPCGELPASEPAGPRPGPPVHVLRARNHSSLVRPGEGPDWPKLISAEPVSGCMSHMYIRRFEVGSYFCASHLPF